MKPPRVFLTQHSPKIKGRAIDLTPALEYGELVVLLEAGQGEELNGTYAARRMAVMLADISDADYLLPIGNPVTIAIAGALAARFNRGRFNVLKWDNRAGTYCPVTVDLNEP